MEINIATYMVRDDSGNADRDATLTKFAADLDSFIAQRGTEEETIKAAVLAVISDLGETRGNVPYVVSQALQKLNVTAFPAQYNELAKRVHSFITQNSRGDNSLLVVGKGKGKAGVSLRVQA